jgi:hypothetical protein
MVGGTVIESIETTAHGSGRRVRRLWCVEGGRSSDECAVYADPEEARKVRTGDKIWWQGRSIYWTDQDGCFEDKEIAKIGFSFDPRPRKQ